MQPPPPVQFHELTLPPKVRRRAGRGAANPGRSGYPNIAIDPKSVTQATAYATSSSGASVTALVATTAEAPQMDVPAAISCASFPSTRINFPTQIVKRNVESTD